MSTLDEILEKLKAHTKLGGDELKEKIDKKQASLSGLVSLEGAAYLVAKEMGVNLLNNEKRKLEIRNIIAGMRNVSVAGRIFKISNIVDFKKSNGTDGRVVNLFVGDKTGFFRMPLWNDQVELVKEGTIKIGDIVQVSGALTQENIYGDVELSLGKYGRIFSVSEEAISAEIDADFPEANELEKYLLGMHTERVPIKSISAGTFEICGTIIDVVKSNFIFYVCPICGGKATRSYGKEKYSCSEHGDVEAEPEMVVSFIVDDGTGLLRVVAFRDVAEQFTTTGVSELDKLSAEERYKLLSGSLVGKEYIVHGRVKKNSNFNRLEMMADSVQNLNISEESEKLSDLLKMKLS